MAGLNRRPLYELAAIYDTASRYIGSGGFRPNLDRFGLPADYETYLWTTYGEGSRINPTRRAFLYSGASELIRRDLGGVLAALYPAPPNPTELETR